MRLAMADEFLRLSAEVQQEVINAAASKLGMLPAVLEKDVWVCYVLKILYAMPDRRPMVFIWWQNLVRPVVYQSF